MSEDISFYLQQIKETLPRLLASYDRDPLSPTLGLGDRVYWAWKTHDFANATSQGAVNGLARLVANDLLPLGLSSDSVLERVDEMVRAVRIITARDGSLVEAFPNEKSFCVTALVAFDILCAIDHLDGIAEPARLADWRETVAPMIEFIVSHDETHAIISNHLATAVAALTRWTAPGAAAADARAAELLEIILANQSHEGWYSEYGAADPGYETLGIYYLADVHLRRPDLGLAGSLSRSLEFLTYCAHPDGSFGGLYGARNTRFIVPGGLEALAAEMPAAAALARFARNSIAAHRVVTLVAIDDPNLAPIFNAYCQAAGVLANAAEPVVSESTVRDLPCERTDPFRRDYLDARLVFDNGPEHYTVVAPGKGGVVVHCRKDGSRVRVDAGSCIRARGRTYSTQALRPDNTYEIDGDSIVITAPFVEIISERPSPFKFLILRVMALTIFRHRWLTEWVKRKLVRRLITRQVLLGPSNRRTVVLGPEISIKDEPNTDDRLEHFAPARAFTSIHMASGGYWQEGDDTP